MANNNGSRLSQRLMERREAEEVPSRQPRCSELDASGHPGKRMRQSSVVQEDIDYDEFERELEREVETLSKAEVRTKRVGGAVVRLAQILLVAFCIYCAFLIYGVFVTNYTYNARGEVVAERLSVEELAILDEYKMMRSYYLRARALYEETLNNDYELSKNPDTGLLIAMQYTETLERVAKLVIDIEAASFSTKYASIHAQLCNWVKTDVAVYLQNVSAAITENNPEKANNAVISREVMYQSFSKLTENIAIIGESVHGADNLDIYSWSPERYIEGLEKGVAE